MVDLGWRIEVEHGDSLEFIASTTSVTRLKNLLDQQ